MSWYKFLFYKYYLFAEALGNKGFYPEVNAWFLATIMPWFNLMTILLVLRLNSVISDSLYSIIVNVSFVIGGVTFIYYVLMDKYEAILKEYKECNVKKRNIVVFFYSIVSVATYFWVAEM